MALSVALSGILGAVFYFLFLGMGVGVLVAHNIWNNRDLQKVRQKEADERCRDSLMDALNGDDMWRHSKGAATRSSTLAAGSHDSQVDPRYRLSTLSFDDSLSINSRRDTKISLSSIMSASTYNSPEISRHRLPDLSRTSENDKPRALNSPTFVVGDISTLSDFDTGDLSNFSVSESSLCHGDGDRRPAGQDQHVGPAPSRG